MLKQGARKIRRPSDETILDGFAGSAADFSVLFSRFESKLELNGATDNAARGGCTW